MSASFRRFPGVVVWEGSVLKSTLAGGVGNGYFASEAGGRGFDSRSERKLR
jgi:hypothetical protein